MHTMRIAAPATSMPLLTNPGMLLTHHPELRIDQDRYNINVTANFGTELDASATLMQIINHDGGCRPAHLYFHVPMCSYVCHFCNYVKRLAPQGAQLDDALDEWTNLLIDESERYLRVVPWLRSARIESLFLGGGTASLLKARHLERIMKHVQENYSLSRDCESTLEGNPDNFLADEAATAVELGFNRFSVGVQSLDSAVNTFAGRRHDRDMSLRAISSLRATGRPFNVDIMFGLPHQTPRSMADDVRTLIELGAPTITIYRLRNVERHKMGIGNRAAWNVEKVRRRLHDQHLFPALQQTYAMREAIVNVLLSNRYRPSPCGWWSAPGTYPDGNIPRVSRNKWQNYDTMVAFGPGAYGWLAGSRRDPVQTHNISDIGEYIRHMRSEFTVPLAFGRHLQGEQAVATALGFAFKANQPIEIDRFSRVYGVNLMQDFPYAAIVQELIGKGLMESCKGKPGFLSPTSDGETLHEEIITTYIHDQIGSLQAPVCHR
jgi:oxygen-independent coproporphyrinogen-3 oxidase